MTPSELKEYIINNDKTLSIINDLGCHGIHERPTYITFGYPNYENTTACSIFLSNLKVNIYSDSSFNGDIFTMIMEIKNITFGETMKYIHKFLELPYEYNKHSTISDKKIDILQVFKKVKTKRYVEHSFEEIEDSVRTHCLPVLHYNWAVEGVIERAREVFDVEYDYCKKRIIIPIKHWQSGITVGINSRTVVNNADILGIRKYLLLEKYNKSANVYGLYENYKYIQEKGYVTIVESEKSVLKRYSVNDKTCVALSGHTISDEQTSILCGLDTDVVICFDKDVSIFEIYNACAKFYMKRRVFYIYDTSDILESKESPCDKNMFDYDILFCNKIEFDTREYEKYKQEIERMKQYGKK